MLGLRPASGSRNEALSPENSHANHGLLVSALPVIVIISIGDLMTAWDVIAAALSLLWVIRAWKVRAFPSIVLFVGVSLSTLAATDVARGEIGFNTVTWVIQLGSLFGSGLYALWVYRRYGHFFAGLTYGFLAAGAYTRVFLAGEGGVIDDPWKYSLGPASAALVLAVLARRPRASGAAAVLLAGVGAVNAARSLAGFLLLAAVSPLGARSTVRNKEGGRRSPVALLMGLAAFGILLSALMQPSVLQDPSLKSNPALERFVEQSHVNSNPLLAGRTELPMNIAVALNSPLLGVGPTRAPDAADVRLSLSVAKEVGYSRPLDLAGWWFRNGVINSHSLLFGMWMRMGIGSALLIGCLFGSLILSALRMHGSRTLNAVLSYALISSAWDALFSPVAPGILAILGFVAAWAMEHSKPSRISDLGSRSF